MNHSYNSLSPAELERLIRKSAKRFVWFYDEGFQGLAQMELQHLMKLISPAGDWARVEKVGRA